MFGNSMDGERVAPSVQFISTGRYSDLSRIESASGRVEKKKAYQLDSWRSDVIVHGWIAHFCKYTAIFSLRKTRNRTVQHNSLE